MTKPTGSWTGLTGYITEEIVKGEVSDYLQRDFYISGPPIMVENYEKLLTSLGVKNKNIHTDYFPGY